MVIRSYWVLVLLTLALLSGIDVMAAERLSLETRISIFFVYVITIPTLTKHPATPSTKNNTENSKTFPSNTNPKLSNPSGVTLFPTGSMNRT